VNRRDVLIANSVFCRTYNLPKRLARVHRLLLKLELYEGVNYGPHYWHMTSRQREIFNLLELRYWDKGRAL
jgi:hypothetical protein